ncbi:MAG: NAD(P)/FAD-dependent oxidoreductase [Cyanobacteria bacterium P01_F01_bin.3]
MLSSVVMSWCLLMRVVVVGGGAAGFFGAIACAQSDPDAEVTVLEASRTVLTKVKISGGGRCNVTHSCFEPAQLVQNYPRGNRALRGAMSRFQPRDTVAWFEQHGVRLKTEADGRMFPVTNQSQTIIDCLLTAATQARVDVQTGTPVRSAIRSDSGCFQLTTKKKQSIDCDRLLVTTGNHPSGYRLANGLGHSLKPPVPSLFTFQVPDRRLHQLAGVSVPNARIRLKLGQTKFEQQGPLLITHWGFSGPAVLKLSAWAARDLHRVGYEGDCQIHWLLELSAEDLRSLLLSVKQDVSRRKIWNHCPVDTPLRLWQYWTSQAQIDAHKRWADLSKIELNRLVQLITQGNFEIVGKGAFKEEFVTCGGVPLNEVNFKTLESRRCPGLFFAGEILDVDGVTGGFNFQHAWTSGWLAGQAMGQTN